jgi:co-chaperonin GroES (HSP10)
MDQKTTSTINSLTPIGFRVLVNVDSKPTQTTSGLSLPESDNNGMPVRAVISVLGTKTWFQNFLMLVGLKPRYQVGQQVYFRKYSVDELKVVTPDGDLILFVLEENEIIGIIN